MWFIFIISLVYVVHSHTSQFNLGCNHQTTGIARNGEHISIQITNPQIQTVVIADVNDTFLHTLSLVDDTDSANDVFHYDSVDNEVSTFTMNELSVGNYTVKLIANEYGGNFNLVMLCSENTFDQGMHHPDSSVVSFK